MKSFKEHTTLLNYGFVKLVTNLSLHRHNFSKSDIIPVYQFGAEVKGTLAGTKLNSRKKNQCDCDIKEIRNKPIEAKSIGLRRLLFKLPRKLHARANYNFFEGTSFVFI